MKYLIWLNLTYACGAIVCNENGVVIESCPIFYRQMVGRQFREIERDLLKKHLLIEWQLAAKEN